MLVVYKGEQDLCNKQEVWSWAERQGAFTGFFGGMPCGTHIVLNFIMKESEIFVINRRFYHGKKARARAFTGFLGCYVELAFS